MLKSNDYLNMNLNFLDLFNFNYKFNREFVINHIDFDNFNIFNNFDFDNLD